MLLAAAFLLLLEPEPRATAQDAERAKAALMARSHAPKQFAQRCEDLRLGGRAPSACSCLRQC